MELLLLILSFCIPALVLAWTLPERWQLLPLSIAAILFFGIYSPVSLVILGSTMLANYYFLKHYPSLNTAAIIVILQLAAIFLFFKLELGVYFGLSPNRIIPIGLSYYAFRQIHYAIEAYKKQLPQHTLLEYFQYLFFLPTILVGPINRFPAFIKDKQRRRWDERLFSLGLERILYGFFKIIVLGNYWLSNKGDAFIQTLYDEHLWLATYLNMVNYAANAYMQFAGYSDVAIGLSMLFGFRVKENFNYPFLAKNISDFWNRWHISLSHWCRDYIYYPFLGITRKPYFSIVASMLILGLWHEISVRYIIWALLHALAINIWHFYNGSRWQKKLNVLPKIQNILGIIVTTHFVMLSFVMIQEDNFEKTLVVYKVLFGL